MVRYAPLVGLLLAAPVMQRAVAGASSVEDALTAWLVAMVVAAGGLWLLAQAMRVGPERPVASVSQRGENGSVSPPQPRERRRSTSGAR